jgi:hypothetical protein
MSSIKLQLLIVIGFIVGIISTHIKLQHIEPTIVSKNLLSYFLGK